MKFNLLNAVCKDVNANSTTTLIEAPYHVCFVIRHVQEGFGACFISSVISEFLCHSVINIIGVIMSLNNRIALQKALLLVSLLNLTILFM